ncbi:MFS transporter [Pseudactinotalea sp. Z1739]|uniref:MFS transporter n=1 Tax=Pseudactinotalea sp. Z1739 TaxID=3413028 RepID=UPI003C7C207F
MLEVLRNAAYARLFRAQVIALLGTGLLTVALGLLAFDLAGVQAGVVLGTALTIKMLAYVGVAPLVSAIAHKVPRKTLMVGADLVRALTALCLPFVDQVWQIYVLIFVLQAASATFTPTFQAVIPEILPDEAQYTRALSLSRLAYDLEALLSPVIAAALLTLVGYHNLFLATVAGFLGSALLVLATRFPPSIPDAAGAFGERLTRGVRVFAKRDQLRSLMAMNIVVACATAMVLVNTVVLVRGVLGRSDAEVAVLLAAYGAGSMLVALALPRTLDRIPDRRVMLTGSALLPLGLAAASALIALAPQAWAALLLLWFVLGAATSSVLTPSARLLRRASTQATRPAVFAAQFSLSHACFILTYPLAGSLGAHLGLPAIALVLAAIAITAAVLARVAWKPGATDVQEPVDAGARAT